MKITVIGGEIGGLSDVWLQKIQHQVTLYEPADYLGDNAKAVDLTLDGVICLFMLLKKLPFDTLLMMTLNPSLDLMIKSEIASCDHENPIFNQAAIDAQSRLSSIRGHNRTWFCGASHSNPLAFHCADQSQAVSP